MIKESAITINGREYPVEYKSMQVSALKFYPQNPRVYSVLNVEEEEPSQEEIWEVMSKLDSVKSLKEDIKNNGGLTDPLVVRGGDNVVLEGNSRLAAYKMLCLINPIKWGNVKCQILPADIGEDAIFTLLGKYHIKGKTNWDPYEQAGYLYRRQVKSKTPIKKIAEDLGVQKSSAEKMIDAYKAMLSHNDHQKKHFSYYLEYYKSPDIRYIREAAPYMDEVIISQIIDGDIDNAKDIRQLSKIAKLAKNNDKGAKKAINEIAENNISIYDAFERLNKAGKFDKSLKVIQDFKKKIMKHTFGEDLKECDHQRVKFEIKKIVKQLTYIEKKLDDDDKDG